jgi:hypothetical protein
MVLLPLRCPADQAFADSTPCLLQGSGYIEFFRRGFQYENLYQATGIFLKDQTGLDDFCVIEYQQGAWRKMTADVPVDILRQGFIPSDQQSGRIPFR